MTEVSWNVDDERQLRTRRGPGARWARTAPARHRRHQLGPGSRRAVLGNQLGGDGVTGWGSTATSPRSFRNSGWSSTGQPTLPRRGRRGARSFSTPQTRGTTKPTNCGWVVTPHKPTFPQAQSDEQHRLLAVKLSEPAPTTRDALQLFKGCFDILRGTNSVKLGLRERQECALVTGIERSTEPSNGGPMFAHVLIAAREVVRGGAVAEPEGRTIEARSFRQTRTVAGTAGEPVRHLGKLTCIRRSAGGHKRYSTSDRLPPVSAHSPRGVVGTLRPTVASVTKATILRRPPHG